ncbi:MAG: hypothetical protein KAZ11_02830, partial [Chitinophagaceae bacterium]|nr:hypothetical protein [Chitinophagaceae bacterium]
MKSYSLYLEEAHLQKDFYPLTLNRTFSELRTGIFSIRDRWHLLASKQGIQINFTNEQSADLSLSAHLIPKHNLELEALFTNKSVDENNFLKINQLWELTTLNIENLLNDFSLIDSNQYLSDTPTKIMLTGKNPVFVHASAQLDHCFINTENGPVLIDANAQIMSGAMLR